MSPKQKSFKWVVAVSLLGLIVAFKLFNLGEYLTLDFLKAKQVVIGGAFRESPVLFSLGYFLIYVLATALSVPGATVLTLLGGALFGLWLGTFLVSFASTIGATGAFLVARYLLRDSIEKKFRSQLERINAGIQKEGGFYLFTLRLIPLFPFFLINLVMGLTKMKTATFFFVSQLGMLLGTMVYVNAGVQLSKIDSLNGILSPGLLLSFAVIGILPMVSKSVVGGMKQRKVYRKFKKPKSFDYNMIVIGAGSAGLVSAYIASAVKAKVALIEKHKMGGDCLNTGCVPSKALIRSAKIVNYIRRSEDFGLNRMIPGFEFSKVMERVQSVVKKVEPHDSVERYTGLGVDCIQGDARIRSPFEVEVNGKVITTKNIVVATGAGPLVPPIPGLSEITPLTSDNIWNLRTLPKRLVVLGGGPIGCELAQAFARFGSQVSLVEMTPRVLIREDPEVSDLIYKRFKNDGIQFFCSHKALRIEKEGESKVLVCEHKGQEVKIAFDEMLLALGRKANVKGFGLEELGVEISQRGTVVADEYLRTTNFSNIYVCGDVTGPFQFTHTAAHQAWYVAVNALFSPVKKFKVDYRVIPWCTFTDPEVARVGLNEQEAKEKNMEYSVSRYELDDLDRAIAESETHGFVKVLTVPGTDKVLGVTIVGSHAGDIIAEYVAAMKHGFGLNKILGTIHIYPTLAEANKYAAGVWKRKNAPQKILNWLARFHAWRRA